MTTRANKLERFTDEMKDRGFFAIVASGEKMADGDAQVPTAVYVRGFDGEPKRVADLPKISADDPRPNGNYQPVHLNLDHGESVASQVGAGWLFVGDDGALHMYGVFGDSDDDATKRVRAMAKMGTLQFSTEGFAKNYNDGYLVTGVAPVLDGNDPGTQIVKNSIIKKGNSIMKKNVVSADVAKTLSESLAALNDALKADGVDVDYATGDADQDGNGDGTLKGATVGGTSPVVMTDDSDDSDSTVTNRLTVNKFSFPQVAGTDGVKEFGGAKLANKLASKEYKNKFGYTLAQNKGNFDATMDAMAEELKRNDITFNPATVSLLPEAITSAYVGLLKSDGSLLARTVNVPGRRFAVAGTVVSQTGAKVRVRTSTGTKTTQNLGIEPRVINANLFYKYISIPDAQFEIDNVEQGGALVDFIVGELIGNWIQKVEEAILVGGVKFDDGTAVPETQFASIMGDAKAANGYATEYTPATGESVLSAAMKAAAEVLPKQGTVDSGKTLVTSAQKLVALKLAFFGEYRSMPTNELLAQTLGVDAIVTPAWLQNVNAAYDSDRNANVDTFLTDYDLAIFDGYQTVGATTPEIRNQFLVRNNAQDYEARGMIGGGLAGVNSAVLVKAQVGA